MALSCRWLLLAGVFFLVTGDGPASTVRVTRWPTFAPQLAWPWIAPVLLSVGAIGLAAAGAIGSFRPDSVRGLLRPVAAVLGAFLLSTIFSQLPALSVESFAMVVLIAACGWACAALLADEPLAAAIWPTVAAAVIFLAFRVIVWRRDESFDVVAFQVANNAWLGKLQLAWVFNLLGPPLLGRFLGSGRWPLSALYALAWAGAGLATYVLFSRIGTIMFVATTMAMALLNPRYWRKMAILLVVAAALGSGSLLRGEQTFRRMLAGLVEPDRNPGIEMRLDAWHEAVRLFQAHPIAGTGIGTYDEAAYQLENATADPLFKGKGWHAHNVYLHILAESGIIGLAAWCYLWFVIGARLAGGWRRAAPPVRSDISGALCAAGAFLTLSMTEVLIGARVHASLRMNVTIVLVMVLGLHAARPGRDRERWIHERGVH